MDQILGLLNLVIDFLSNQFVDISTSVIVIITGLYYAAKNITKLTPSEKDDQVVEKIEEVLRKLFDDFPMDFPSEEEKEDTVKKIARNVVKK